jgi:Rrf2 family iron-sulfur cluster assembly transcriptional regulator
LKVSTKGRYAVIAMVELALLSQSEPVSLSQIARRLNISQSYLEQLFVKMRRSNLVRSTRGPGGGYVLARPATEKNNVLISISVAGLARTYPPPGPRVLLTKLDLLILTKSCSR